MRKIAAMIIIGILNINIAYAGDLMTDYNNANQHNANYQFGVNLSAPYSGNTQIASVGGNASLNKGCGMLGALSSLTASFNTQAMENLGVALLSSAPTLLLCYASQTLCDAYKFARNMAQAMAHLSTMNCQQVEKLAINAGDGLRKEGVQQCINQKWGAGSNTNDSASFMNAVSQCESDPSSNPITNFLNVGGSSGSYSLSQWVNNQYPSSQYPLLNTALSTIVGDVSWGGGGKRPVTPLLGLETMQSQASQVCYSAIKNVIEGAVSSGTAPSSSDLAAISLPGQPVTTYFATKLMTLPPDTRDSFYSQYSTVYGTVVTLTTMQSTEDGLEAALEMAAGPQQREDIRDKIAKVKTRMGYLTQQLDMQRNYLNPMVASVMQYNLPATINKAAPTAQEMQDAMPKGISQ